jgi:hypothetical protein
MARADFRGGPPWALFRTAGADAACRVVWADLGRRLVVAALHGAEARAHVPLNTCYVAVAADARSALALTALLNSRWLRAFAAAMAPPAASGFRRFNARVVEALPCPDDAVHDATLAELAAHAAAGSDVQEAIDRQAADLLGLDAEERRALAAEADAPR